MKFFCAFALSVIAVSASVSSAAPIEVCRLATQTNCAFEFDGCVAGSVRVVAFCGWNDEIRYQTKYSVSAFLMGNDRKLKNEISAELAANDFVAVEIPGIAHHSIFIKKQEAPRPNESLCYVLGNWANAIRCTKGTRISIANGDEKTPDVTLQKNGYIKVAPNLFWK